MNLWGSFHRFFAAVLADPLETNRHIIATGNLTREVNEGHECHMFRLAEFETLLIQAGLRDIELLADGWVIPNDSGEDIGSRHG